jgi:hypothetical protein
VFKYTGDDLPVRWRRSASAFSQNIVRLTAQATIT